MRLRSVIRLCCVIGLLGTSAPLQPAAQAADHEVALRGNAFDPRSVEVGVGDKIVWRHDDGASPHSVTSHAGQDESFDSHPNCSPLCMQDGDTFERTFNTAGTFTYFCKIHGSANDPDCAGMCGAVVVRAGAEPPPPEQAAPPPPEQPPAPPPAAARATPPPTPTPVPTETRTETPTPALTATPLAVDDDGSEPSSGRGTFVALAIVAAVIAAGGGFFAWRRFGRAAS